ncbi:neutrophil cytosol factor 2 [Pelobates cultripes]|uniref:Neutrophil cytosol factor 2 n=1 Tax=Pelobates cultripes TaxID=61616 RepID=A0AAD1WJW1_PELCU|nr:neutrophil cytosol factor 2 [Pelobates cultripes]
MALVEIMRLWSEGVVAAEKGDWNEALKCFTSISDPRAKICFNIGCCHLVLENLQLAEEAFTLTIERDNHLAVGYFQRGLVFFKSGKYMSALQDWVRTFTEMRGNQLIDYKILGMTFQLYSCEILYNIALAHAKLGEWAKSEENLLLALSQKSEPRHSTKIDKALQNILKQKDFPLAQMPKGKMFQPNEKLIEQLDKRDFLGKALVVASVVDKDSFSGFAPLQPQTRNPPPRPKTPEVLTTLQGEPHRVLFEFNPETSEEIQVMPGNIVFLVMKGADNWATVMFNGKKGIVPYNYLQPVELRFQQTQPAASHEVPSTSVPPEQIDIPAPPTIVPPARPNTVKSSTNEKQKTACSEHLYMVKVYYKYTVAIQTPHKLAYEDLLLLISSKLKCTPCSIKLSFKDGDADVTLNKDNIEKAWELITDNCLKLKCTDLEAEESPVVVEEIDSQNTLQDQGNTEIHVTALFDYEASQPEDLSFKKGAIIKVLSKVSKDWWEGEHQGKVGIFPTAFVK